MAQSPIGMWLKSASAPTLKAQIPNLSYPEVALGLAGLILKNGMGVKWQFCSA